MSKCETCKYNDLRVGEEPCYSCAQSGPAYSNWTPEDKDAVTHPTHYNRKGAMECIDEMQLVFGREAVMHFCLLNAWKYRYRAADKNGAEDLRKSDWYLSEYKRLAEVNE